MNRSDFVERLWTSSQLPRRGVYLAVNTMLEHMIETLATGERVALQEFGSFSPTLVEAHLAGLRAAALSSVAPGRDGPSETAPPRDIWAACRGRAFASRLPQTTPKVRALFSNACSTGYARWRLRLRASLDSDAAGFKLVQRPLQ
jgi:hypothetical protein